MDCERPGSFSSSLKAPSIIPVALWKVVIVTDCWSSASSSALAAVEADLKQAREALRKVVTRFENCVVEATAFYNGLVRRQEGEFSKDSRRAGSEEEESEEEEFLDKPARARLMSIQRCHVYLGDLARYRIQHTSSGDLITSSGDKAKHTKKSTMSTGKRGAGNHRPG